MRFRHRRPQLDMEALQAQVADHSGSLEDLTTETYRRADELAAAIQSLHKVNINTRPGLLTIPWPWTSAPAESGRPLARRLYLPDKTEKQSQSK